jgi:AcrR family transcriptional regulator
VVENGDPGRPVDGRAARWAGQRAKRRAEIVAAGLAAIGEHGPGVSTEQIAARAGIARPRLYRHFADAEDLYDAVAQRAAELIVAEMVPVLTRPSGTARGIITRVVRTFVVWLTDNLSLYRYVVLRSADERVGRDSLIADVRTSISELLRDLLAGYLAVFQLDTRIADPLAFGLVGMVESSTGRWLVEPGVFAHEDLVVALSSWVWGLLDSVLRSAGITLDPDVPLPALP